MKENEIRPKDLLLKYLNLVESDSKKLDKAKFLEIPCPACKSESYTKHIYKNEYNYVLCNECGSLFCNPRPSEEILEEFYRAAESSQFWLDVFFPTVAESRREKLFRPKAERIFKYFKEKKFHPAKICDVGSGYGIFLEEMLHFFTGSEVFGVEPSLEMVEISRNKGINTLNATAENSTEWSNQFDLVISSEVIEHVFSASKFINSIFNLVKPGGYCLLTGLGYEGFDILTLQEKSNSVFPPHHLNFMSVCGFEIAFKNAGFSETEILTPGELDVDIVLNSGYETEFIRVLRNRGADAISEFQSFLKKYQLSSHIWVFAKK
ncbi:methyltransferase domain-containing protein [Leptospira borgpetersenii]|uniref:Methylase/methyltransferase n=3 Tax=Leptospira borgpetersenii TaxID=174 RepID=Q04TK8_LEPBJ|nr:methyltransferase domain-containing protein [Leptospira borgpetersenii]ABJ75762.1 Methylase/methyltransferase [Leptospira borgpetersenii serovar Hardjo-bovis str. JB197]ABJ78707.1 Methylase/methyltransferase [Leptospira borgpetersenii serovar Hardjo-bovis str. L550]AMX59067.1 30S ribosomal protein S27ae [Leptospira borgpetersenii serovar Hardjo]AMX61226.1 30S ribosomal protein S27ae [Leptospira borgpetersenii serovar Hardjo]AMX64470.1 30S ribosomal protein S27ae [Leptospira borgpetersenii s